MKSAISVRQATLHTAQVNMKMIKKSSLAPARFSAFTAAAAAASTLTASRHDCVAHTRDVESLPHDKPFDADLLRRRNDVLRSLLRSPAPGRCAQALSILRGMLAADSTCRPDPATCSIVFSSLSRQSQLLDDEALGILVEVAKMGFFPFDAFQFTQLINKLCRSGFTSGAWDLFHAVKEAGGAVQAPVCNALLTGLGAVRDFARMNLLFSEMKAMGVRPNVVTFGILVNHLCKSRRLDDAMKVFDVMTGPESDVTPDTITFNTLIDGHCKAGRLQDGLSLLDRMRSSHACEPDTITYNSLIDGFFKAGEITTAHELLTRMEKERVPLTRMEKERVPPNVVTLNIFVCGLCRQGIVGSALDFFRKKQVEWPQVRGSVVAYSTLIGAFLHSNNVGRAMALFDEMLKEGHSPDSVTYFTLISGLTQAGRLDDSYSVASSMKDNGFKLDAKSYNTLISGFCKKKKLDKAHKLLHEMCESGLSPDVFTYNSLIAASCKAGDFTTVDQLLNKMVDDGCKPSVVTYGAVIHGYCRAGGLDQAMKIFRSMDASAVPANTVIYNILIDSFSKSRKVDVAISLVNEMQERDVPMNITTYNALLKGLRDFNMCDKAFELMDQMSAQGCKPDCVTMDVLTEWFAMIGEMERLKRFMQQMTPSEGQSPDPNVVSAL